jgi:hypothetical protein
LRAEGFSFSLDVLYGGLGISRLQFLKNLNKISGRCFFFIKTLDPDPYPDSLERLDPDPDSMHPDPKHCFHGLNLGPIS